jgi:hypothetical protein
LETSIRRLSRHGDGAPGTSTDRADRRAAARALGPSALVELDGSLTALTLIDGRLARHDLGGLSAVTEEVEWLRFALLRLTQPAQRSAQRQTAIDGARASADAVQRRLLWPLEQLIGDRSVVLVPTGALHAVPWPVLPAMRGRPLIVAPSHRRTVAPSHRRCRAGLRCRRPADGAATAHLACHGRVRADSPLFSSLGLADGQLNAYDLQRLRRSPDPVVLSACDLAVSDAQPGDELLGFAAALIAAGTRTIIASVLPAPDAQTKLLMISLHHRMLAGEAPPRHRQARRHGWPRARWRSEVSCASAAAEPTASQQNRRSDVSGRDARALLSRLTGMDRRASQLRSKSPR